MRKLTGQCVRGLLIFAVCLSCPAAAATFEPAPHLGNLTIDLDSASGHFSVWSLSDIASLDTIQAKVSMNRLGNDDRWLPVAQISLEDGNDSIRFMIVAASRRAPVTLEVAHAANNAVAERKTFDATLGIGEKIDVTIRWTPAGEVVVALSNGEQLSARLGRAPTRISISGSTGEAEFNPLSIGRTRP